MTRCGYQDLAYNEHAGIHCRVCGQIMGEEFLGIMAAALPEYELRKNPEIYQLVKDRRAASAKAQQG